MTYPTAVQGARQKHSSDPEPSTKLHGAWLGMAWVVWLALVLFVAAVLAAILPSNYWTTWGEWQVGQARPAVRAWLSYGSFVRTLTIVELSGAVMALAVGMVVAWKKPRDRMGLVVSGTLILTAPLLISPNIEVWRFPAWLSGMAPLLTIMPLVAMAAILLLLYWFPDGRFAPAWMRWPALATLAIVAGLWTATRLQAHGYFQKAPPLEDYSWLLLIVTFASNLVIASGAQVYRYRHLANAVQRQQVKWVLLGLASFLLWIATGLLGLAGWSGPWLALISIVTAYLPFILIPLTIGISILRYRLWDIDFVLNRTLVYFSLTLVILGIYGVLIGGLVLLLQGRMEPALAVLAAAAVALLALPLQQRLQRGVNRLMYGERDEPMAVLTRLGRELEAAGAPESVLPTLAAAIADAMRLPYVAITLQSEGGIWPVAAYPSVGFDPGPAVDLIRLPLAYQGQTIGTLIAAGRAPGERFSPSDERLLQSIARQAGAAAHALGLTSDLQRSRERLVTAREEERRRLRHNLHDDLGPRLATLTLKLDAARNLLPIDPAEADNILTQTKGDIQSAIVEVRHLVYDLRPPALDQLGLAGALRQHAAEIDSTSLQVRFHAPDRMPALPAAVEVAAYRIATEALTNVVKHARASQCHLTIALETSALWIDVSDNGSGLAENCQPGVGMTSMRERAEELGGVCTISSVHGEGTRVSARLPVPS